MPPTASSEPWGFPSPPGSWKIADPCGHVVLSAPPREAPRPRQRRAWAAPRIPGREASADGLPVHRGRGAHWRRKDEPLQHPVGAAERAARARSGGGEPLPLQLLHGPAEVRLPDADLLPVVALPAAAGAVPAGPLPLRHGQRL